MTPGVSQISWFFLFAFALNGLIAISILIFKNKTLRLANLLLGINLLGISMIAIVITMVETGLILKVPHFYRLPSPLYYLMFPAAWLYVKLIITDRTRLEKTDYLHFLPALIHLVEMTPFYLKSADEKLIAINEAVTHHIDIYAHHEGWLPPYVHNLVRGIIAIIYAFAMWRLLKKVNSNKHAANNFTINTIQWLKTFTLINAWIGAATVLFLTLVFIPADIRSVGLTLVFLISLTISNIYLFFRPEILYGLPQPAATISDAKIKDPGKPDDFLNTTEQAEIPSFIFQYKNQIHEYLVSSLRFLEPEFNLQDLSRDTGIPKHHLQLLIHKAEGKKFGEFINEYRIEHLRVQIENGGIKSKTLEGLAAESGFSSKATFIRSVKRLTGKTPKEYFIPGKLSNK
jgi:AraC-like DNA-binding protein